MVCDCDTCMHIHVCKHKEIMEKLYNELEKVRISLEDKSVVYAKDLNFIEAIEVTCSYYKTIK